MLSAFCELGVNIPLNCAINCSVGALGANSGPRIFWARFPFDSRGSERIEVGDTALELRDVLDEFNDGGVDCGVRNASLLLPNDCRELLRGGRVDLID